MLYEILTHRLPERVPAPMRGAVSSVRQASSRRAALRRAYDILTGRFYGSHVKTYLLIHRLIEGDLARVWRRKGYAHCTVLNHLLRILLVRSGWFSEDEVRVRWTLVWGVSPHQYVRVRLGRERVNIDVWGCANGVPFGEYAHGFV